MVDRDCGHLDDLAAEDVAALGHVALDRRSLTKRHLSHLIDTVYWPVATSNLVEPLNSSETSFDSFKYIFFFL